MESVPKFNMHFELAKFAEASSGIHIAADYSFWVPLIRYFLNEADEFEIHCWEDEEAAVEEILVVVKDAACRKEGKVLIVSGVLKEEAKNFIVSQALDESGNLKWFSVFLSQNGKSRFSSEHYGTEFTGTGLKQQQRDFFEGALPAGTSVDEW
ncbi:hypothetical protein ACTL32_08900 [Planococcus sp. FY231025]|uniref:hypothetical protein n=1 Tax=Planococcus sp. FY231025 TaxID=3455699 RepID=UPI003F910A19